jgi:hypothetical protein
MAAWFHYLLLILREGKDTAEAVIVLRSGDSIHRQLPQFIVKVRFDCVAKYCRLEGRNILMFKFVRGGTKHNYSPLDFWCLSEFTSRIFNSPASLGP